MQFFLKRGGLEFSRWWEATSNTLRSEQRDDGSWRDEIGENFATAMAVLILTAPMGNLTIFKLEDPADTELREAKSDGRENGETGKKKKTRRSERICIKQPSWPQPKRELL